MNKCIYCDKKIDTEWDSNFEWYGIDCDVIHQCCKGKQNKQIDRVNRMSDKEFKNYIVK